MNEHISKESVAAATVIQPRQEPREAARPSPGDGTPERVALELTQYIRYWDPAEKTKKSRNDILNLYAECLQVARLGRNVSR